MIRADDWGWRHAGRRAWAIRHLSLDIEHGERVLLLGQSGAGKSTLLAALAGILGGADEGEQEGVLTVDGQAPAELRGHAALMMQEPESQIVLARVGDDVAFGAENLGVPPTEIWERVRANLSAVGLALPLDHPTDHLSGGQQQRLVLAGALAMGANLLLLDEPTANLDPTGVVEVRRAVAELVADRRRTLIVVEHRSAVWADLMDRVIVLTPVGVVADGPPEDVFAQHGRALTDMGVWVPGSVPKHAVPSEDVSGGTLPFGTCFDPLLPAGPGRSRDMAFQQVPRQPLTIDPLDSRAGLRRSLHDRRVEHRFRDQAPNDGNRQLVLSTAEPAILAADDLSVGYTTPVRTGLSFEVPEGASTVITGPNGSGKTTTAFTLAGLLPPLGGAVRAADGLAPNGRTSPHSWKSKELLTRIGTVFQAPDHQFVAATVYDEIAVGLRAWTRDRAAIDRQVNRLLAALHLADLAKANPFTLSGGEKRRLSVATVLACQPRVIILDEPTFGQDRRTWLSLVALITDLRDQGTTIISVTHDQDYIDALGQHRIHLGCDDE